MLDVGCQSTVFQLRAVVPRWELVLHDIAGDLPRRAVHFLQRSDGCTAYSGCITLRSGHVTAVLQLVHAGTESSRSTNCKEADEYILNNLQRTRMVMVSFLLNTSSPGPSIRGRIDFVFTA